MFPWKANAVTLYSKWMNPHCSFAIGLLSISKQKSQCVKGRRKEGKIKRDREGRRRKERKNRKNEGKEGRRGGNKKEERKRKRERERRIFLCKVSE